MTRSGRRTSANQTREALRVLAADLRDVALDLQAGSYTRTTLAMFQRDLRRAVPSGLGATISFDLDAHSGVPKEMHLLERTLDPSEIAAGLRIPLTPPPQSIAGSVLLYASLRGAFDDVVEGLLTLLDSHTGLADLAPVLPHTPLSPSFGAVTDFSVVGDALGVLINRGLTLTEARADLHDCAAQAHISLPAAARKLLDGLPTRQGHHAASLFRTGVPVVPQASVGTDKPTRRTDGLAT